MSNLRTGTYGNYYGSYFNESVSLSTDKQKVNALYIYKYLTANGWTINAISAILGNMQAESAINSGRWQSNNVGNYSGGYGLVQWTPASKYIDWCTSNGYNDPSEMDNNLKRIIYEINNGLQWIKTDSYPLTFKEFSVSTQTPEYLGKSFVKNYERPADQSQSALERRGAFARSWYTFLTSGELPDVPVNPDTPSGNIIKKKKSYKFILFNRRMRNVNQRRFY